MPPVAAKRLGPDHPEAARLCAEVLGGELQGRPWAVRAVRIVTRTDDDAAGGGARGDVVHGWVDADLDCRQTHAGRTYHL